MSRCILYGAQFRSSLSRVASAVPGPTRFARPAAMARVTCRTRFVLTLPHRGICHRARRAAALCWLRAQRPFLSDRVLAYGDPGAAFVREANL